LAFLAQAEEVAVLVLGEVDRQAAVADRAVQQPLEMMRVLALAGTAHRTRGQQPLHGVEGGVIDQRLVAAVVLHALVGDLADVGGVVQQGGDAVERQRPAGLVAAA
jgi:hypothetical protein